MGVIDTVAEAEGHARRLREVRGQQGATGDFAVITALSDAFAPDHFVAAEAGGVTEARTMPWAYCHGLGATLAQRIDGMDALRPMSSTRCRRRSRVQHGALDPSP